LEQVGSVFKAPGKDFTWDPGPLVVPQEDSERWDSGLTLPNFSRVLPTPIKLPRGGGIPNGRVGQHHFCGGREEKLSEGGPKRALYSGGALLTWGGIHPGDVLISL